MKKLASLMTRTLHTWNVPILAIVAIIGLALCCSSAMAQSGAGSIQGTVTDSTGAVIPGAAIHVVNQATNVATDTKSNNVGFYQVPALFTATYSVTVTAPNMKTYKTSIQLLVAQDAVINPVMTAGAVTQQVEVAANTVQLTTSDNGTITSTLENQRINQLPLNDRLLTSLLAMTTPGYLGSSTGGTALNGLSGESMEYVADGVPMVNRQFGGTNTSNALDPDPDAIQEVQAVTDNGGAQYATPGTVVITTKSGTNQIHGSAFETARNNAIGIAKSRSNPSNYAAPELIRNEWGMSGGGPIVLPHVYHGKDKSFWFVAYERYSLAQKATAAFVVLDQNQRAGNFSELLSIAAAPPIYDPATTTANAACPLPTGGTQNNPYCRTQFDYNGTLNAINPAREAPLMKILNDIEPLPNLAGVNPYTTTNLNGPNPSFTVIPTWTFRLDHEFNEKNRAYLRYTGIVNTNTGLRNYPNDEPGSLAADGLPAFASGGAYNPTSNFGAAIGYTHVFSPNFFSETIMSQQWEDQHNFALGTPLANYEGNILKTPNNFGEPGFPQIGPLPGVGGNDVGYSSYPLRWLDGTQFIYGISQIITNLDENLTETRGRHQMQFGGRVRHERFGYAFDEAGDTVSFTSQATGLLNPSTIAAGTYGQTTNTGDVNADEFLGAANSFSVNSPTPYGHYHDYEYDAYFQDNFHWTRNLTLNIGLRYEAHPALSVANNLMVSFDYNHDAEVMSDTPAHHIATGNTTQAIITNMENIGVVFENPQQAGFPSALISSYNFNFMPRVALAWQPFDGKWGTVIRGGYGRYIFPVPVRSVYKDDMATYPNRAGYSYSFSNAAQSPDLVPNWLLRQNSSAAGYPVAGTNISGVVNTNSTTAILPNLSMTSITPDEAPDFATQINFTIEQPLKGNSALRVSWVWAHGTDLDQEYFPNNHYSTIAWELKTGTKPPTGSTIGLPTYAATALGPYDNTVWGSNTLDQRSGWTNDNQLQVNYQRLFHNGFAYQIYYDWSKAFREGGNYFRDGTLDTAQDYVTSGVGSYTEYANETPVTTPILPPARPAGIPSYAYWHDFDRWADYFMDTAIPVQEIRFNAVVDMPFGRGKHFLPGANKLLDEIVGGWQVAADGTMASQDFYVGNGNWGVNNPIKMYKTSKTVTDCRSGVCYPAHLWFNGYIAPSQVSGTAASTCTAIVSGLPSDWKPYSSPLDTNYVAKAGGGCPGSTDPYYNTNNVQVNLANGTTDNQGYAPGPTATTPWRHTLLQGPKNFTADASLFKVLPISESARLRFNFDAFNVFNVQGLNNPSGSDGTMPYTPQYSSSHNTPRQVQLTLRIEF